MLHVVLETFLWLFGLCVGSFLNVVIYRLPAGLSVAEPARSFCPRCKAGIAWYDNLPVLSWLLLGGRCRHCKAGISIQYPLVEALTGLTFVLVYHLLFVMQARDGVAHVLLPQDTTLFLAWLVLAAALIACSAMDIVSYTVDVRITLIALALCVVLYAFWPRATFLCPRAETPGGAAALLAFVVSAFALWLTVWRVPLDEDGETDESDEPTPEDSRVHRVAGGLGMVWFVLLTVGLVYAGLVAGVYRGLLLELAAGVCLIAMFLATVLIGGQQRVADDEIREAIEEEQPQARRTALRELAWLAPMIIVGVLAYAAVQFMPGVRHGWQAVVAWTPGGGFVPVAGVVYSIHGAIVGAAAGWVLRILFTLAFGREAFGVGDIYILAAAGAAAGADIALLGLLLSVGIALIGWILGLLLKTTVMIPFGPWLALGFLLALLWNEHLLRIVRDYAGNLVFAWHQRPDLVATGAGLMLVATAAAIVLARLVRRWVDPA